MQRGEAVAKQYISMCLHSPRLQLLSPASSPAWSMPSPKGEGAEPCPSLQPSISVLGCGGPVAPWSFMGKCVCTRGKMEEPPAPHCVDEEGPNLVCEELPDGWFRAWIRWIPPAMWFAALLVFMRSTAGPKNFHPRFILQNGPVFQNMFAFSRFCQWAQHRSVVSSVPLRVSQVPHSCCSFSVQWESLVSLSSRCVARLRAQKPGLAVKMQASYHSWIQTAKKGSFSRKHLAARKPVLLQAPAREMQVSFRVRRAELPWEKAFSVIPTSSMFSFQRLFTVNYCFRLYPFLLSFFSPGNCFEALEG